MANTTNLNVRVDDTVKKQAEQIYSELGLSMSAAINTFLRQTVRYGGIPFELRLERPNAETIAALDEVERMKRDPSLGKTYTDVDL